ncbi:hypothetical protein TNCV_2833391 [Trichonephila clavipes]|nr:hypothetical protein TNCV_2833391 [Trichonephila clavipes]
MCWTKLSNCDADLSSLDAKENNGRGRSHPPCCVTGRDDRRIVRMEVMDPVATSRTKAQQIESVTHYLVSTCTIRRHFL